MRNLWNGSDHAILVASVSLASSGSATGIDSYTDYSETGLATNTTTTASAVGGQTGYTWLGETGRGSHADTGLVLMGDRLYNPVTSRFTSLDPVMGGGENAYTYPNDPINESDITGDFGLSMALHFLAGTLLSFAEDWLSATCGPALMILCGAVIGGVANSIQQIIENVSSHKSWKDGIGHAFLVGMMYGASGAFVAFIKIIAKAEGRANFVKQVKSILSFIRRHLPSFVRRVFLTMINIVVGVVTWALNRAVERAATNDSGGKCRVGRPC